ncbi:hypothetical protein EIP91_008359 [Steccherinum ochraceum]|uniref:Enoyl reductase (ER) domain-containing protein n=1 Tax=Steccherinum ochraceum TaxID=92696 RepID=A0A4R0RNL1_9APHY|nr:hypothetical protein EIP91_008359 [Steccherinum ochraceum]
MAPVKNGRVVYKEVPSGYPEPGKTLVYDESQTIDLDNVSLHGGILTKTLSLSLDPFLRGKMRDSKIKSYSPAFVLGEPIYNDGVSIVLRSENKSVQAGDHVISNISAQLLICSFSSPWVQRIRATDFQEYSVISSESKWTVVENEHNLSWGAFLGVLGMPGHTAYSGWREFAFPEKGDVVFVSAGAGTVGSLVIQIAKSEGLKVVASAGSDDKVDFIRSLGADVAFNYKKQKTSDVLAKEGPINIYWDNVGGETLDAALAATAGRARIICCGHISDYNADKPSSITNLGLAVSRELRISGFLIASIWPKYEKKFYDELPKAVASGNIKHVVHETKGLEKTGQAFKDMLTGVTSGKNIVVVAEK